MIREITINFKDKNMKKGNFMFKVLLMLIAGIFLSIDAFAQQITVKGIVKDTTGEPVIGANVVVKGTTTGVITDQTTGKTYQAAPFPEFIKGIIESGGLLNSLKARGVAK